VPAELIRQPPNTGPPTNMPPQSPPLLDSASAARHISTMPRPLPPYSSGIVMPRMPCSTRVLQNSRGKPYSSSIFCQ